MTKREFVTAACIASLAAHGVERFGPEAAQRMKANAESLASLLDLDDHAMNDAGMKQYAKALERIGELQRLLEQKMSRIAELEEQLEQATAPAKRGR